MLMTRHCKQSKQSGSIALIVLLFLPLLLVMGGLGADLGKLYVTKSELQNAADACALAGAAQFDGLSNEQTRASGAGLTVAQNNRAYFQKNVIASGEVTITFPTSSNGVNGKYVRCSISRSGISNWITPLLNRIGGSVNTTQALTAVATATTLPSQTACAIPIGICQPDVAGKNPGDWLAGVASPNNGNKDTTLSGHFRWVDFTSGGGGANELADILSGKQSTDCSVKASTNQYIGTPGYKASLRDDFNTRFGIKKKNEASSGYFPDVSGKGYYNPAQTNRYVADFVPNAVPNNTAYSDISGITISNAYGYMTSTDLKAYGTNRRVAIAPVVDCTTMKLKSFVCVFLLHPMPTTSSVNFNMYIEYLGNASTSVTPCSKAGGLVGGGSVLGPKVAALVE